MKSTDITHYFARRASVVHFLVLLLFFVVIAVVFVPADPLLRHTAGLSTLPVAFVASVVALCGMLLVVVSRLLLARTCRLGAVSPAGVGSWLLVELLVCVAAMCTALWLVAGRGHLVLAPLAADLALVSLALQAVPYVVSFLLFQIHEERAEVERLRALLPQAAAEERAAAAADATVRFVDKGGKLVLSTARSSILYIEAANNYTNIHYLLDGHEETFILHNSLKELEQQLAGTSLVRCHRGYVVNLDNVKLMRRDGTGFILELAGAARTVPVTKTYAEAVVSRSDIS